MEHEAITNDNRQEAAAPHDLKPRPASIVWPPPPKQQAPQTVIVRGPSAGLVITFFLGKFATIGALIGAIATVVVCLFAEPKYVVLAAFLGIIVGAIAGFLEGTVFGILACVLYACGLNSDKIGRITCWVVPIANAGAWAPLFNFMQGGTPVPIWMSVGISVSGGAMSWLASKNVSNRFVERF